MNREKVVQLGKEGLRRVLNYFTWKQVADVVAGVYGEVLNSQTVVMPAGAKELAARPWTPILVSRSNGRAAERKKRLPRLTPIYERNRVHERNGTLLRSANGSGIHRDGSYGEPSINNGLKAVFFDKDDLVSESYQEAIQPGRLLLADNAALGLRMLQAYNYKLFVVTNQPEIAHGSICEQAFAETITKISALFLRARVALSGLYYCPHHPSAALSSYAVECTCRKPMPGLLLQAAEEHRLDLESCWMIGKVFDDIEAGKRAQCRTILVNERGEGSIKFLRALRRPDHLASSIDQAAHIIVGLEAEYSTAAGLF